MVDEVWHAVFQAIYKGVEGVEWEHSYFQFVEVNKDVKARHRSGSSKAEMLWKMRDATDRGDTHHVQPHAMKVDRREEVRQVLKSPTFALSECAAESGDVG